MRNQSRSLASPMQDRVRYFAALRRVRTAVCPDYVGQESFMSTNEILELAQLGGINANTHLLDLCCGVAGPGRYIAHHTACRLLGIDCCESAIVFARHAAQTAGLRAEFLVAKVPPVPINIQFDVVMLLETMLAFEDKKSLLTEVAAKLVDGGSFITTFEEGTSLNDDERLAMPGGDDIWLVSLDSMLRMLESVGLLVQFCEDRTDAHQQLALRLRDAFIADAPNITASLGKEMYDALVKSHDMWVEWLGCRRVRKFSIVGSLLHRP